MANLKRNMIELVTEVKEGEVVTKKFLTPAFLPLSVVYEALDLSADLEGVEINEREKLEKLVDFTANEVYGKQFTSEELISGLHAPQALDTLRDQLMFAAYGAQNDETKNFLAKKN